MIMVLNILFFALGLVLVVKGGDFFVDAASWIAKAMRIPTFIIGATIVSVATTMPEMLVSVIAAVNGDTEMAIGNAVGSVTVNTAMIMALSMVAMSIAFPRKLYLKQSLLLIAAVAILWTASMNSVLFIICSVLLALLFVYFMFENVRSAKKTQIDSADTVTDNKKREPIDKKKLAFNIVLFLFGAAGIVGGSQLMVTFGEKIAVGLGVPDRVIAVTMIAIGTSLPELVTTITAIVKKESALSVGNIVGANIIDISLILPLCALVSGKPLPVSQASRWFDLPACLLVTLIALLPMIFRQKASKVQGVVLLFIYVGYVAVTVFVMPAVFTA